VVGYLGPYCGALFYVRQDFLAMVQSLISVIKNFSSHTPAYQYPALRFTKSTSGRRPGVYRILFQVVGHMVYILHIRHAARDAVRRSDLPD